MCSRQTNGFCQSLITSWHIFPVHHYWLRSVRSFLSVNCISIQLSAMKMSYLLPRAILLPVTLFMTQSYLLLSENFAISRTRRTRIPVFALNLDLVKNIVYTKNHILFNMWTVLICTVDSGRKIASVRTIGYYCTKNMDPVPHGFIDGYQIRHIKPKMIALQNSATRVGDFAGHFVPTGVTLTVVYSKSRHVMVRLWPCEIKDVIG